MIQLPVHQVSLHQVDVFAAGHTFVTQGAGPLMGTLKRHFLEGGNEGEVRGNEREVRGKRGVNEGK